MAVTLGGIDLLDWAAVAGWAAGNQPLFDLAEPFVVDWPGRPGHLWGLRQPTWHTKVGCLFWPAGASRFAVGHWLADEARVAALRPLVAKGGYSALPFRLDDGGRALRAGLWLLPPRPLSQRAGANGMYLLTLVDDRFWWWQRAALVTVTGGTTTWATLFSMIGDALGVTIAVDTISGAYLKPPASLSGRYDHLPPLLDAACASVGHRLVRRFDGTVVTQAARTALAVQDARTARQAALPKQAGGEFALGR